MTDIIVVGAGPAGVLAALRAADLGARTTCRQIPLVPGFWRHGGQRRSRSGAHPGPCRPADLRGPAAGSIWRQRERADAQLSSTAGAGARSRQRCACSLLFAPADRRSGVVTFHEHAGGVRFTDQHTIETEDGRRLQAQKIIICTGGESRRLSVPGFELTNTHSDAWGLTSVPKSMLVVGAGADGSAGRLDFQCVRLGSPTLPDRPTHSAE